MSKYWSELAVRKGLSLVEIAVATGVLAAVMVPVMLAFSSGSRGVQMTQEDFLAHQAAIEVIEQLQATPFEFLPTGTFSDADLVDGKPLDKDLPIPLRLSPVKDMKRTCVIELVKKGGKIRFKKVKVTIFREGKSMKTTPLVLKVLIANDQI